MNTGNIVELFSSIQGEGKYIGYRQLFLRFSGCNLNCTYCDTIGSHDIPAYAKIEIIPGSGTFKSIPNPLCIDQLLEAISKLLVVSHHSLSLTGGEPLLQSNLLQSLLPQLSKIIPIYLETNGVLYEELEVLLPWIKHISMDIKLPSALNRNYYYEHQKFIETAYQHEKDLFIKLVISDQTSQSEVVEALSLIKKVSPNIPLILQPVTPVGPHGSLSGAKLLEWQTFALEYIHNVRVIPQAHRMINVL